MGSEGQLCSWLVVFVAVRWFSPWPPSLFSSCMRWSRGVSSTVTVEKRHTACYCVWENPGTERNIQGLSWDQRTTENNFNYGSGSSQINRCGTADGAAVSNPEPGWKSFGWRARSGIFTEEVPQNNIHSINSNNKKKCSTQKLLRDWGE